MDTHADTHVAAALDPVGGLLGVGEFPATPAGYARLLGWLGGFGTVALVGIEGTGSYGAGLARHMSPRPASGSSRWTARTARTAAGRASPTRWTRSALPRAAQSGRARGAPKGRDGAVEAIRALMVARRSAAGERTRTINQARALILTGPDDLRARFTRHTPAALVSRARRRCGPVPATSPAMPSASRCGNWGGARSSSAASSSRLDELIVPLVTARAPGLLALYGVGPAPPRCCSSPPGTIPERLRSRGRLGAPVRAAPIPASSGKVTRHRLNPGGDRQANHALWRIVFTRLGSDPATRAYAERRTAEGNPRRRSSAA